MTILSKCVCVCTICIDVKLQCRGVWHSCPTTRNEAVGMSGMGNLAGFLYLHLYIYVCVYIYIYTYIHTYEILRP